jgi:hypothetical protein
MEPVKPTPDAPTYFEGFMGALAVSGAALLVDHLTDQKHSPGRTAAIVLNLLFVVGGIVGLLISRTKRRRSR